MLTEQISLDELDIYKVSVETKQFVEVDGILYQVGTAHRCAYSNSEQDRLLISEELPEPYLSAVMAVWGQAELASKSRQNFIQKEDFSSRKNNL